jgi:hypothetical protein
MAIASAPSSTGSSRPGAAISAFSTVQLASAFGPSFPFDLVAVVLVVFAAVVFLLLRDRLVYGALADYSFGYVLLALTAASAGALTATVVRRRVEERSARR